MCTVTEGELDALSASLQMEFQTLVSHTVAAFTRRNMADARYAYTTKAQPGAGLQFTWKQEVGDIKVM